jgi:hypothetical protein
VNKIVGASPRKIDMRWQACIHGVGNLVEIVADAAQLSEQRRVHRPITRRRSGFDLALADQLFAQARD